MWLPCQTKRPPWTLARACHSRTPGYTFFPGYVLFFFDSLITDFNDICKCRSATEDSHFTRSPGMRGGQRAASEVDICLHHLAAIKKHFLCQSTVVIVKKGFKAFVHVSSSRSWVTTPNKAVRLCTFSPFYIKQFKYLCRLVKAKIKSFIICIGYSKSNSQYHYYHWSPHPTPCLLWHAAYHWYCQSSMDLMELRPSRGCLRVVSGCPAPGSQRTAEAGAFLVWQRVVWLWLRLCRDTESPLLGNTPLHVDPEP